VYNQLSLSINLYVGAVSIYDGSHTRHDSKTTLGLLTNTITDTLKTVPVCAVMAADKSCVEHCMATEEEIKLGTRVKRCRGSHVYSGFEIQLVTD